MGCLSRCCGQSPGRWNHQSAVFPPTREMDSAPPFPRATSRRPLRPTPHNARRGEGRLGKKWRIFSASSRPFQKTGQRPFARACESRRPLRLQTKRVAAIGRAWKEDGDPIVPKQSVPSPTLPWGEADVHTYPGVFHHYMFLRWRRGGVEV